MTRSILAAALVAVLALPTAAATETSPLLRAVQARGGAAYRGELLVAAWDDAGTHVTLAKAEHDPPNWSRLAYRPMGSSQRWVVLRRGMVEIQYDPASRTGTSTQRLPTDDDTFLTSHLPWLMANYDVSVTPGLLLGRKTDHVEFRPKTADRPTRRIDVDQETGVILRSVRIGTDGRLGEFTSFVRFEVMPRGWRTGSAVPASLRLTHQQSLRPITAEGAVRLLGHQPVAVIPPAGFHRVADYLTDERVPVLQTVYSDGLSVLVVSQHRASVAAPPQGSRVVTARGGPVWIHAMGLRTLVHWSHQGWVLTMVGDVRTDRLLRAAEQTGIAPAPRLLDRMLAWFKRVTSSF